MPALLERITGLWARRRPIPVAEWFGVRCDTSAIYLNARPPGGGSWTTAIPWSSITRVCFKAEGFALSDGILLFTREREASWAVPMEASGGQELWAELIRRGLFDAELAIEAMRAADGVFCWPPVEVAGAGPRAKAVPAHPA